MNIKNLYEKHQFRLRKFYSKIIQQNNIDTIVIHSGKEDYYFQDDQSIYYKAFPHFIHWIPYRKPDSFLVIEAEKNPTLYYCKFDDFWYEQNSEPSEFWSDFFNTIPIKDASYFWKSISKNNIEKYVYLGKDTKIAKEYGIPDANINPNKILRPINYNRRLKDEYEVYCIDEANKKASLGHKAVIEAFYNDKSEFDINQIYLKAVHHTENETPYPNIIALNEKASILHFTGRRPNPPETSYSLLIDAGADFLGYASDITRTYVAKKFKNSSLFSDILDRMRLLLDDVIKSIKTGLSYTDLHKYAHKLVSEILSETGIINMSADDIFTRNISSYFFPHGLGHLLGIQVHDIAGHYKNESGELLPPPDEYPYLRLTQTIENGHTFTIEPGIYFIDCLLAKIREDDELRKLVNWILIDDLRPFGGIRIEDNIYVKDNTPLNLTRKYLDN